MSPQRFDLVAVAHEIAQVAIDPTQRNEVAVHTMLVIGQGQRPAQVGDDRLTRRQRLL